MKPFVMKGMTMSEDGIARFVNRRIVESENDFLHKRLQAEIDELALRMDALFKNINELREKNNG
jgi:cell division protein FtsB